MIVKLLTEHNLEFLCLKGVCTGSSESSLVKVSHCWKSHVAAHIELFSDARQCNRKIGNSIVKAQSMHISFPFNASHAFLLSADFYQHYCFKNSSGGNISVKQFVSRSGQTF